MYLHRCLIHVRHLRKFHWTEFTVIVHITSGNVLQAHGVSLLPAASLSRSIHFTSFVNHVQVLSIPCDTHSLAAFGLFS